MMSTTSNVDVTATGASETPEPAVGGRCSPQVSSSPASTQSVDVLRQASTASNGAGKTTAGEGAKQALSSGHKATEETAGISASNKPVGPQQRTIDIGALSEEALLDLLRGYINSMYAFAQTNRNVHKELKETLANSNRVMSQYTKVLKLREDKDTRLRTQATAQTLSNVKHISVVTQTSLGSEYFRKAKKSNAGTQTSSIASPDVGTKRRTTVEKATDTPCWWEAGPTRQKQPGRRIPTEKPADNTDKHETPGKDPEAEFEVVRSKKRKGKKGTDKVPKEQAVQVNTTAPRTMKTVAGKHRRPPRTQAVVLEKPGDKSYADIVKEVKETVQQESLSFEISARRAKSGNLVLETLDKEQADSLACVLKRRFGDSRGVRRPIPSVALILIGIEDSVNEEELKGTLEAHDPELKAQNEIKIREGSNGVRTAIVRVPVSPGLKLARLKKLKIGWSRCRIKELAARPKGCVRCSSLEHEARECTGVEKRRCFRCKVVGHLIASCKSPNRDANSGELDQSPRVEVRDKGSSPPSCP